MMNGWRHDMDAGNWIFMLLLWVVLLAVIGWVLTSLFGRGSSREVRERPEEILDRRLAAGEIDVKTYDELRAKLIASAEKRP
jgi:putative membrane protein